MNRLFLVFFGLAVAATAGAAEPSERVVIDTRAKGEPFPHFWEQMFGSGRAILSLRESYREDLRRVRGATELRYLRFHDILDDDVGLVPRDQKGPIRYNFTWVDEIYDGLLENRVRPFVELSFMPRALAADLRPHPFWYQPIPSPPKDYKQWADLVRAFTAHMVERNGLPEVNQWYFEVWNEPNLDFWTGKPQQETYFKLYDAAARAVKSVAPTLRVGGPATAQAAWIPEFIRHCARDHVPVDFISTHIYGNDPPVAIGASRPVPLRDMVALAAQKVYREVRSSALPRLPIIFSEYNAYWSTDPAVTDSSFMGPWLANTIRECDGLATMMSYWDFSDVFDEQGVASKPFYGGYGLIAEGHIPKAAFNAFALLHRLAAERLPAAAPWILATRRSDGSLVMAVWHYADPRAAGPKREYDIELKDWTGAAVARVQYLETDRESALGAWNRMGAPNFPTREQREKLQEAAKLSPASAVELDCGTLRLTLPVHGLALVEISSGSAR